MHTRPSIGSTSALSARDRLLLAALAVLALLAPLVAAPPASALASGVGQRVVFNDPLKPAHNFPTDPMRDNVIAYELEQGIAQAPAGAKIRISTWRWTLPNSTNIAKAAMDRGVDIRIALNSASEVYDETKRLKSLLGDRVTYCGKGFGNGACTSSRDGGTQHAKLMTVSALNNGKRNLVYVTSSNVSAGQITGSFNDLVITNDDPDCYAKVTNYLDDAVEQKQRGTNYRASAEGHFACPASQQEWWLGPHASSDGTMDEERSTDDLRNVLNSVVGGPGCLFLVAESKIDDTRDSTVVREYRDAKNAGCFTSAFTRMQNDSTADGARALFAGSSTTTSDDIPWTSDIRDTGEPGTIDSTRHMHSKVTIVRDPNGPDYVVHGSEHPTRDFRRNDEALVKSSNLDTILAYENWYRGLTRRSSLPAVP